MGTLTPLKRVSPRAEPTSDGGGSARRLSAGLIAAFDASDERVLVLIGQLDAAASRPLRRLLRDVMHRCTPGMVVSIDLAEVTSTEGGGLAALVVAQRLASARRCALVLRQPSADVQAALAAHRLDGTFAIIS
jgi:ABC-type transporter Mla MlaB component